VERAESAAGAPVYSLLKGRDAKKDQSYVLHVLGQKDLARAMFPLGNFVKAEVRQMAREFGLPTAERAESQDLCFLTQGDYRGFLTRNAPGVAAPGAIVNTRGEVLGRHEGLPFYTVGQRKGINLAPHTSTAEPMYVLKLNAGDNTLVVGALSQLGASQALVRTMHYVSGQPPAERLRCTAKIRYKAKEAPGWLAPGPNGSATFEFDEPQRDVSPGQGLVAYDGDAVIGGGVMSRASALEAG
jgi:tRNA-specific 2-thiouridylase